VFFNDVFDHVRTRFNLVSVGMLSSEYAGNIEGVPIHIGMAMDRSKRATITATRPRGSDVGLTVSTGFGDGRLFDTGDRDFDGIFARRCARGDEQAARAICNSTARQHLHAMARAGDPTLTDGYASVSLSLFAISKEEIERLVLDAVAAASAADQCLDELDPPAAIVGAGLDRALTDAARPNGFAVRKHPFALAGTTAHGDQFLLRMTAHSPTFRAIDIAPPSPQGCAVHVSWREPLEGSISARPANLVDRAQTMLGFGDIIVGDPEFDKAFTLSARGEGDAAQRVIASQLNERARSLLMRARSMGMQCALDERRLFAFGPQPASGEAAQEIVRLFTAVGPALRDRGPSGPYR